MAGSFFQNQVTSIKSFYSRFLPVEKIHIEQFLGLSKKHLLIDVRSPSEYKHAHIPGAYNLPLFTDEERKAVGTAYKQKSRGAAIKIALDSFGPKMRKMIEEIESATCLPDGRAGLMAPGSRLILIYCWRGGMRSAAVAWLMDLYGFKVFTLAGGYKKFRHHVLETFEIPFHFKILGGFTGTGKTALIKELEKRGETVINLEETAKHKGSAFGNIEMHEQPGQEMFENLLAQELRKKSVKECKTSAAGIHYSLIWLEDESQRIGLVNLPNDLWNTMRRSPVYFIKIPFEERLKQLVHEYGSLDRKKMAEAIGRIRDRLGGLNAKNAAQFLIDGNISECFRILLQYYDKHYLKALHNREEINSLLYEINCDSVTIENADKLVSLRQYHSEVS